MVGGSGAIGAHVVEELIEDGNEVTVLDLRPPHIDIRHIYVDITDLASVTAALTGKYDAVYILAAMSDVNDIYHNPSEAARANVLGIVNTLEAARRNEIGRVLFASTVWVYELAAEEHVDEETPLVLTRGNHTYTSSKVAGELYCHSYNKLYGLNFTIMRYGIPYGPRGRLGTVVANCVDRALRGEPLIIHGDGSQKRNFIYVRDLAKGNVAALSDAALNQTYNLDGPRPVSIKEVAETVASLIPGVRIEYQPGRAGDYEGKITGSAKAKRDLGWEPTTELAEGIAEYIAWYQTNLIGSAGKRVALPA